MPYVPMTPARLVDELADRIDRRTEPRPRVGFDGFAEIGTEDLADAVADRLRELGRPVIRCSTPWWWRAASLRLELGGTDVDMLLHGWVDTPALRRELLEPVAAASDTGYLPRLRDPSTDRTVRVARRPIPPRVVVILGGPFLLVDPSGLDMVVHLQVSPAAATRALPTERRWWVAAYQQYRDGESPAERADAVVNYDHPANPAIRWRPG